MREREVARQKKVISQFQQQQQQQQQQAPGGAQQQQFQQAGKVFYQPLSSSHVVHERQSKSSLLIPVYQPVGSLFILAESK